MSRLCGYNPRIAVVLCGVYAKKLPPALLLPDKLLPIRSAVFNNIGSRALERQLAGGHVPGLAVIRVHTTNPYLAADLPALQLNQLRAALKAAQALRLRLPIAVKVFALLGLDLPNVPCYAARAARPITGRFAHGHGRGEDAARLQLPPAVRAVDRLFKRKLIVSSRLPCHGTCAGSQHAQPQRRKILRVRRVDCDRVHLQIPPSGRHHNARDAARLILIADAPCDRVCSGIDPKEIVRSIKHAAIQ